MRNSLSAGLFCLALAASAASPDFRTPPLGAAGLATNYIMTWGGYTLGAGRNGYADHIWIDRDEPTTELTVCSWVAIHDADGANYAPGGGAYSLRASSALPKLYYSPNVEKSAPDILDGAWGWGANAVTVSGSLSNNYGFPAAGTSGGGGGLGDLVVSCDNFEIDAYSHVGPINGDLRFTVPYTTPQGWSGYVLEGQSEPTDPGDVMSRDYIICDPGTGGHLVMIFNYGSEFLSIQDLYTDHPSVQNYFGSYTGTLTMSRVTPEPPFWESVGWNGGATGTNAFPRGVYTVAWTNLSSTMTLTAGGADMTLEAPAGVRNVQPGEASGFILTGSGSGKIGISRMKVHPFYATGGASGSSASAIERMLVGTNWCFVAHRIRLGSATHTNDLAVFAADGRRYGSGHDCELPPDGTRALLPSGWYQLLYLAIGEMRCTYVYEWDRRVFDKWLSDADLSAIYDDGVRIRAAFGYPPAVVSNAVYQVDP